MDYQLNAFHLYKRQLLKRFTTFYLVLLFRPTLGGGGEDDEAEMDRRKVTFFFFFFDCPRSIWVAAYSAKKINK